MTDSKKILKAIPWKIDGRFITDTQALSMPSLYEAIVELLTNVVLFNIIRISKIIPKTIIII